MERIMSAYRDKVNEKRNINARYPYQNISFDDWITRLYNDKKKSNFFDPHWRPQYYSYREIDWDEVFLLRT